MLFDSEIWQEIFGSIKKNKIRTIITVIGVLWGIFIYVVLSGAAKGLDNGFERQFSNVAINSLFVWAESTSIPYEGFKIGRFPRLKLDDVEILKKRIPEIKYIVPRNARGTFSGGSPANIVRGDNSGNYAIYGDYPDFIKIATKEIYDGGRFINESDIKNNRKVCVIGERTLTELFDLEENPIGQYVRIDNVYFKVIGVSVFRQGSPFDSDSDVFIPFSTYQNLYNVSDISKIGEMPDQGVRFCFVNLPNSQIELIEPLGDNSPIQNFLDKNPKGGQHHICFEVKDIHEAKKEMEDKGATVLNEPRIGAHGTPIIFIHPKNSDGVLIELMETPRD